MNISCASSGGTTLGAGGGVGDGRVGAIDIDAGAGDVGTFVDTGDGSAPDGPAADMPYGEAGDDIAYEVGNDIFDGAGDGGTFIGIGDGALTICGAAIGSSFCPLFDSLPLPLP